MLEAVGLKRLPFVGALSALTTLAALGAWLAASCVADAARVAQGTEPLVEVVRLDGIVGPGTARYVLRGLSQAASDNAQLLVIEIDTPGGSLKSMDDITKAMLSSAVPTAAFVYPSGGRAASAGVFIVYAAGIAAMAPTTHLGAAHPVALGGGGIDKTEMTKLTNDAVAEIRGLATRHGRNAAWAEQAVRESVSITDAQALQLHVVDLIAGSPRELLAMIDGRQVQTASGERRLETRSARIVEIPMNLAEQLLLLLGDPNVGFILMTVAIYGIIFELSNPGSVFPGVIGGLALILAFASFAIVAVNVAGLLLIGFALILFIADLKVTSHGVLTAGGIASFVLGSLLLTENQAPFLRISLALILTIAVLTGAFFLFAVGAGLRAQARRVRTGREALLGELATARSDLAPAGMVLVDGELWSAEVVDGSVPTGELVRVVQVSGLHLKVRKAAEARQKEGMR